MCRILTARFVYALLIAIPVLYPAAFADETEQCWAQPNKIAIRKGNIYYNVLYARTELEAYDAMVAENTDYLNLLGDTGYALTSLNVMRGEILKCAISAYFFGGSQNYPKDNVALIEMLDSLQPDDVCYLQVPTTLEDLVICGILDHLPASPYSSGSYVYSLPDSPVAGDVYYYPFAVKQENSFLDTPGLFESNVLVIFDKEDELNNNLLSDDEMDDEFPGDLSKFIPRGKYTTVCFIYGADPDSW